MSVYECYTTIDQRSVGKPLDTSDRSFMRGFVPLTVAERNVIPTIPGSQGHLPMPYCAAP